MNTRKHHVEHGRTWMLVGVAALAALCAGCASKPATTHSWAEIGENWWRIVIDSRGGARVDVIGSVGPPHGEETVTHTMFAPCEPEEAARFIRAMQALIEHSALAPRSSLRDEWLMMGGGELARSVPLRLRYQTGPAIRSTRVPSPVAETNLVLKGLIDEAQAIAHFELADGVANAAWAEQLIKRNRWDEAAWRWEFPWRGADNWYKCMAERKPEVGRPERAIRVVPVPASNAEEQEQWAKAMNRRTAAETELAQAEEGMSKWLIYRTNNSIPQPLVIFMPTRKEDPTKDTSRWREQFHRDEWNERIRDTVILERDGDATTVRFTREAVCPLGRTVYPPEVIPSDCLEFLKAAVWNKPQQQEKGE